jgi:negative regulator of genetic competence, sporulation and motility
MENMNEEHETQEDQLLTDTQEGHINHTHSADFMDLNSILDNMISEDSKRSRRRERTSKTIVYRFKQFSDLEQFCKVWNTDQPVRSQLLREEQTAGYLLLIEQGRLSKQNYARLGEALAEYASFVTDQPLKITSIREHAAVVIEKNAIDKLRDL